MKSVILVCEITPELFVVSARGTFGGGYSGLRVSRENIVVTCTRELRRYGTTKEGVEFLGPDWIREQLPEQLRN